MCASSLGLLLLHRSVFLYPSNDANSPVELACSFDIAKADGCTAKTVEKGDARLDLVCLSLLSSVANLFYGWAEGFLDKLLQGSRKHSENWEGNPNYLKAEEVTA